ncbi:MAG: glycosyltransferase family 2 protein [Candidatus Roizmanbacteria bacterium]|nr:glycosyltransferase family 2 protein [Candidatus Roizmanbacteria bacterium]
MLKSSLTLTIPTFNEEENIRIPLDSAYDLVDEVLIVDGGSSDKTVEIAKSYGPKVRVLSVDNPANFLVNKQRAIDTAKGEWILQLDADERLSPELKEEIINWKLNFIHSSPIVGYWIPRKNWFLGRYLMKGGVYPDGVLRLYQRDKAHFKLENVHENAIVDGETAWTQNAIEHMADPTFARYIERWHRYNAFDAQQLAKKGEKPCLPCYLVVKPILTFLSIYLRHKGFMDGWPGFLWAFFSSIRYWEIYWKATTHKV